VRPVESIERALQVLKLFIADEADEGLSVNATARSLGVANSTVSRIFATMVAEGFLVVDPSTRRYHVGPAAFEVGGRFSAARLARSMRPLLQELTRVTGHTSQFGTLADARILYLGVVESPSRLRVVATPGHSRLAHTSAMGKALLAQLSDRALEYVLVQLVDADGALSASGPGTHRTRAELVADLAAIRARGYSVSRQDAEEGVSAIGMVVPWGVVPQIAISVAFPSTQFPSNIRTLINPMRSVADAAARIAAGRSV
jgi:DNA-binding IclR family transcriptional regulator